MTTLSRLMLVTLSPLLTPLLLRRSAGARLGEEVCVEWTLLFLLRERDVVDAVKLLTRFELFFGTGSVGSMMLGARDEASETGTRW